MNKPREKGDKNLERINYKGRGKEAEFRSTKKQKNELHILKMSQEWDLRRQKRRMDRQKWVEERRNQKLPIWQRVGNLRVQANEEIAHDTRNELVNKKQQIIENSNEAIQTGVLNQYGKVKEHSLEAQGKGLDNVLLVQSSKGTTFREKEKIDAAEMKFIESEKVKTMGQPLLYNVSALKTSKISTQVTEKGPVAAFKTPSKSPNKQAGEHLESGKSTDIGLEQAGNRNEANPVAIQKLLRLEPTNGLSEKSNRKRKLEAIYVDADIDEMPSLMCVDKPTTLENMTRESGPVTISSAANNAVVIKTSHKSVDRTENEKEEGMPQIKQYYSLLNRRDEAPNVNFFGAKKSPTKSSPVSICKASPVTMTTTSSEVKVQVALPSVPVDSKCIMYLAKSPVLAPTPTTPTNPRPGYLVPVYKASTREATYAFLPAGAQRTHRVGDKSMSSFEGRAPDHRRSEYSMKDSCTTVGHYVTRPYPSPNSMTALKEAHTGCVPATGKLLSGSQAPPALYSDHIHPNTRVHLCCDLISDTTTNPSRTDSVNTTGGPPCSSSKNSLVNILKTITTHSVGLPRGTTTLPSSAPPLVQEISGAHLTPQERLPYPPLCRIQEIAPNQAVLNAQEPIFNPMSVYVRAKLVPREVVAINQGVEPSPPLVEYIKTDAICDKELTKWSVKNVADFIAATDCADKAELFLEQEIDGKALLSLSPEMLMKGLNLKLGPSVKLYNHIVNLRTALST